VLLAFLALDLLGLNLLDALALGLPQRLADVGLHLRPVLLLVQSLSDVLHFLHELVLEVLRAGVVVHYLLLQRLELFSELLDSLRISQSARCLPLLHCSYEFL
jgi:hypothetical protein